MPLLGSCPQGVGSHLFGSFPLLHSTTSMFPLASSVKRAAMFPSLKAVAGIIAFAAMPLCANAALTVVSDFNTNNSLDGWLPFASGDVRTTLTWRSHGAGLGGYIDLDEGASGAKDYFQAPAKFLGNLSAYMGGTLSFDLRVMPDNANAAASMWMDDIVLVGANGMRLFYSFGASPVRNDWLHYEIALAGIDPDAPAAPYDQTTPGWYFDTANHTANSTTWGVQRNVAVMPAQATNAQMAAVLANVQALYIKGDHRAGAENVHLGNVELTAVPVPEPMTTAALLAASVLALVAVRRCRAVGCVSDLSQPR